MTLIDLEDWDILSHPGTCMTIVVKPIGDAHGIVRINDELVLFSRARAYRLRGSSAWASRLAGKTMAIVAQASSRIVRETLVPVVEPDLSLHRGDHA